MLAILLHCDVIKKKENKTKKTNILNEIMSCDLKKITNVV